MTELARRQVLTSLAAAPFAGLTLAAVLADPNLARAAAAGPAAGPGGPRPVSAAHSWGPDRRGGHPAGAVASGGVGGLKGTAAG